MPEELTADQVRRVCDPASLGCVTTEEIAPLETIVGQPRATQALEFGLGIHQKGFNIYVAGPPGTGKATAVTGFVESLARGLPPPPDTCYVHNFADPSRPTVLRLPPGRGRQLQQAMRTVVQRARHEFPRAFESEEYSARQAEILRVVKKERDDLLSHLNQQAHQEGFTIQATPVGLFVLPVINGQAASEQQLAALEARQQEELRRRQEALTEQLRDSLKRTRALEKSAQERVEALNHEVARYVVSGLLDDLYEAFEGSPQVVHYLHQVQEDMVTNPEPFLSQPEVPQGSGAPPPWTREAGLRKYAVNLLVDHGDGDGVPAVYELNPSYPNLFGRIEREAILGTLQADFTLIRAGALHRANGGYLVVPVEDLLRNPFSYDALKRAIRSGEISIEDPSERLGIPLARSVQAEPVPLDIKVVLVGGPYLYHLLHALDEDFRELFKVKADFDTRMDHTEENVHHYLAFICSICKKEGLRPLEAPAVAKVVEQGSRLAEDQQKLSTRFSELADVLREADHWAAKEGAQCTTADHVARAVRHKTYRSNLIEERIQEIIRRGTLRVETTGEAVGQVNGLVVITTGEYSFGRPSRVTASVGLGQQGVVDIEREARLGGPIHTKGVLILGGYLSQKYAQDKPLSLAARLVFEQSYEGVEGDSASSTELYALLSALSGLPIQQRLAVTGSVDQQGRVQAIGGANQKIEGFFDVCRAQGLTGNQGVPIPRSNVQNLMLREDVVEAVREGRFHIYPVDTVDQGIELLTGVPAGERQPDGSYPPGTVNYLVDQRLREMAERMRSFGRPGQGEPKGEARPPDEERDARRP